MRYAQLALAKLDEEAVQVSTRVPSCRRCCERVLKRLNALGRLPAATHSLAWVLPSGRAPPCR